MNRRPSEDEFLRFAESYLRQTFPNPAREGCPADSELRRLAQKPTDADAAVSEHISCCSPCFARYMDLLHEQRTRPLVARLRNYWALHRGRVIFAASAAVLVFSLGILMVLSLLRRGQPAYSDFTIDLSAASVVRGPEKETPQQEVTVPRSRLNLIVQLPLGSEEGPYRVSLRSGATVVWSEAADARLVNRIVTLKARIDLNRFAPGRYLLTVESNNEIRFSQPIQVTADRTPKRSSLGKRFVASLTSTLVSLQLPLRRGQRNFSPEAGSSDPQKLVAEADRLAWLGNGAAAGPLYARAEVLAAQSEQGAN